MTHAQHSRGPEGKADATGTTDATGARRSRFNISRWALEHVPLTRYLAVVLLVLGSLAYFQLGQNEDPPFTFRVMMVRAYWPGATAQQMADQVADRLERTLQEVPQAGKIRSYAKPGEVTILFELRDSTPGTRVPQLWYTVRKKLQDDAHSLPPGVQGPFFNDDFGDVYGVIYALRGPGFSPAELKDLADDVRRQLLRVPDVAKVEIFGAQPEQVHVTLSLQRIAGMGLGVQQVLAQLQQQNAITDAGTIHTPQEQVRLRVSGQFQTLADVAAMQLRGPGGAQIRLGDIADITRGYADPPAVKVRHDGQDVLALGIAMSAGGDIIALGQSLRTATQRIAAALPAGVELVNVQDQPEVVRTSVNEFVQVLAEAVIVVLGVSFLSLGLHRRTNLAPSAPWWRRWYLNPRPGLVVALTIPLVLAATFLAMWYWNIGLHKVSLGALIIALGLLVDDAIIAVEMMVLKMEEGHDRLRAATFAYEITAIPMLTGTLITAAGFLPIGMARSVTGEYTFAIFAVTVIALVISWIASVYFVPWLGVLLLKSPASRQAPDATIHSDSGHEVFDSPFYLRFRRVVRWCVAHRWVTIAATCAVFGLGLLGMTQVQQQFFPNSNRNEILMEVWLPEGSSFANTEATVREMEAVVRQQPGIASVTAWVGSGVPRFFLPLNQIMPQSNVAQFILMTQGLRERDALMQSLPQLLAQQFPQVRARPQLLSSGPPVAYPVQFRVVGDDPAQLRILADEARALLQAHPALHGVNDDWNESIKTLDMHIDQGRARALGISSQSLAQATSANFGGLTIGLLHEGDRRSPIVLRTPAQQRDDPDDLAHVYLQTASGAALPLTQIVRPTPGWEPGVIWRQGREYAITVQGDTRAGVQGATVTADLLPRMRALQAQWHDKDMTGYRIEVAGAVEESRKGQASIAAGLPVMLFVVFTLLMLQLHSFSRAVLVFITGPLGIAGVAAALLLLDRPFGFVALLGVVALMGMIQRNSVILIDQISRGMAEGLSHHDAIIEAAVRRLRPIALTAAAAVLAMIPLSGSAFWGPMAVAIMGGLIVATVLTLLALPAMYAAWFKVRADDHAPPA